MADDIVTPYGTLSFCNLYEAVPQMGDASKMVFQANLVIDQDQQKSAQMKKLKEAVIAKAEEKFGKDWKKKNLRLPFRDSSERDYEGYDEGTIFFTARTTRKPGVVDVNNSLILDPEAVWPGQTARFNVSVFAYDTKGNKGISLSLNAVKILKQDAPRLDGRKAAENSFDDVEEDEAFLKEAPKEGAATANGAASPQSSDGGLMSDML